MHEGQWVVIFICLLLGAYFLITGLIGVRSKKMTVVNPEHSSASPGLLGKLMQKARSTNTPKWQIDSHSPSKLIGGKDAFVRGIVHIIFGFVILIITAAYVWVYWN